MDDDVMRRSIVAQLCLATVLSALATAPAKADDWPTLPDWATLPEWMIRHKADPVGPNSLFQMACSLDEVEEKIHDDGVVSIKQPDVWSQASMTKYRKDFEQQMQASLNKFGFILSAKVTRSDQASVSSQNSLGASLTPLAPSTGGGSGGGLMRRGGGASTAVTSPTTVIALPNASDVISERNAQQQIANNLLSTPDPSINRNAPFALFSNGKPFQDIGESSGKLGLEPNEFLKQKQSYLEHLNQLRRINLGGDNADAAGYGLYLLSVPVSIQPGECTYKGHGAVMTVTAKHEFGRNFLPETYRIFVINDLVDILTPVIYEMIRSGYAEELIARHELITTKRAEIASKQLELEQKTAELKAKQPEFIQRKAEFRALQPDLSLSLGRWAADIVNPGLIPVLEEIVPETDDDDALAKKTTELNTDPQREEKARAIREAVEIIHKIIALVPREPQLASIDSALSVISENQWKAEKGFIGHQDMRSLKRATVELKGLMSGITSLIERGMIQRITMTTQGKMILSELGNIGEDYFSLFEPAPARVALAELAQQSRWLKLFEPTSKKRSPEDRIKKPTPADAARQLHQTSASIFQRQTTGAQQQVDAGILGRLGNTLFPLLELVTDQDTLTLTVTQLPGEIAAAQAQVAQASQQSASLPFARWVGTFLPLTRTGTDYYPVALSDYDDVFLRANFEAMAKLTTVALGTKTPRFSDVRAFLRRELDAAYNLVPYFSPFIATIHQHVIDRSFRELEVDYTRMAMALPGNLQGDTKHLLSILSWAIAVDAGLLNGLICDHVKNMNGRGGFDCPEPDNLVFYWHEYLPVAPEPQIFQEVIKRNWPILTFAVDPVVDEQNIADAASVHRELQLALAFAFAAGRISFNSLNRYTRRLEYDAETLALNQTVTSFTQGQATFGWRFYPRFQNPPPEATNLNVIANILIRGGQGRNYQMDNSKLEPGKRELTAVVVMPSFVPYVKFESTGNWFLLHDPEHLKVPTDRMLRQSQKVAVLKQELNVTEDCGHFREGDLEQLKTRIEQVEQILPMQTQRVNVPFSEVSGFELFTPISGSQALVPQLLGYDGADYIDPSMSTDFVLYGKRFSILETQVVVGGKYLTRDPDPEKSRMDIISRDVMRVLLPAGLQPTVFKDGKKYVEVVVSTPNGVSNRFPIPFGPPSSPQATPEPLNLETGYTLLDDLLKVAANVTPANSQQGGGTQSGQSATTIQATHTIQVTQGGQPQQAPAQANQPGNASGQGGQSGGAPKLTAAPTKVAKGTRIRLMSRTPPAKPSDTVKVDFRFPVASSPDAVISVIVEGIPYKNNAYVIDESVLDHSFVPDLINKLDGFGKLTGQSALHELTTKTILITPDGSDSNPKATTNQLHVSIELFVQKKPSATPPKTAADAPTFSATVSDGTGRSASASITGGTTKAVTNPSTQNAAPSTSDPGTTPTGTGAQAPSSPVPPDVGAATGGNTSPSRGPLGGLVGSISSPPAELGKSTFHDPVITQARLAPIPDSPARARPMPGLAARQGPPGSGSSDLARRGESGTSSPAPPRGLAQPMPPRLDTPPTPSRPATRSSAGTPRGEPAAAEQKPRRRSLISRIMGKD
jgi:hypothetical protein